VIADRPTIDRPAVDLEALLRDERAEVERALERACEWLGDELPDELLQPARHAVLSRGKRLRPILCVVAYRAGGGTRHAHQHSLQLSPVVTLSLENAIPRPLRGAVNQPIAWFLRSIRGSGIVFLSRKNTGDPSFVWEVPGNYCKYSGNCFLQ
jgi:hypothetical protein